MSICNKLFTTTVTLISTLVIPGDVNQFCCTGICCTLVCLSVHVFQYGVLGVYVAVCVCVCAFACISASAYASTCKDLPMLQHAFQCASVSLHGCQMVCQQPTQSARQPTSSLTFHPATVSPSLLHISLFPLISCCLCLHQGKCHCTHLGTGLADQSRPGSIRSPRCSQKTRGERERGRENQSGWALDTCSWQVSQAWST